MHRLLRGFAVVATLAMILRCGVSQQQPAPSATPETPAASPAAAAGCDSLIPPPDAQFPANFDYPQTATTVQSWAQTGHGHRTRRHAYCLFAGLNYVAPGEPNPTWRNWGTTSQVFRYQYNPWKGTGADGRPLSGEDAQPVTLNEARNQGGDESDPNPIVNPPPIYGIHRDVANNPKYQRCRQAIPKTSPQLYSLRDGTAFQSNGDILIAAVSYNPAALTNIVRTDLYNAAALDARLPMLPTSPPHTIPPFPSSSIVLKVMLWPVAGGGPTWSSVTALPVWDWEANKPGSPSDGQYAGYEMQKFWKRAVAISSSPVTGSGGVQRVQFLYGVLQPQPNPPQPNIPLGPNTYDGQVVGLDRFYSRKYSDADLTRMDDCDRAILDASAYWSYNRAFQAGDSLALVAMHIMTKEQSDWTFQSAWWHPDALGCTNSSRFCGDQPTVVPGSDTKWKNYMITTTYGQVQQSGNNNYYVPPGTQGAAWPVAYNPYIELAASHPITTNCMNCHHRAAWPPLDSVNKPDRGRASAYLQSGQANPNALERFPPDKGVFNGLVMVDSMWAVSDRAGYYAPGTQ